MIDCIYVLISIVYAATGLLYGYVLWCYLEVVDKNARGLDF